MLIIPVLEANSYLFSNGVQLPFLLETSRASSLPMTAIVFTVLSPACPPLQPHPSVALITVTSTCTHLPRRPCWWRHNYFSYAAHSSWKAFLFWKYYPLRRHPPYLENPSWNPKAGLSPHPCVSIVPSVSFYSAMPFVFNAQLWDAANGLHTVFLIANAH
jgi:hypothetical protein